MPKRIELSAVPHKETIAQLGKVKTQKVKFSKSATKSKTLNARRKAWAKGIKVAKVEKTKLNKIKAPTLTSSNLKKLQAIHQSTTPTAEAIKNQKMGPVEITGLVYSSMVALEYTKMKSEFKNRLKKARTSVQRKKVEAEWKEIVKAGQTAYSRAGLKLTEKGLDKQAKTLTRSKSNLNTVATISSRATSLSRNPTSLKRASIVGGIVTLNEVLPISDIVGTTIEDLCSRPFAEGSFTKHFSRTFSLRVRVPYWCPTWRKPWRMCSKTVTLASLSFSVDVNVGYRVTCCGAVAWGQASAQVCASILGKRFCAGCTAKITGVAGFGRTGSGNRCTYGLGINASLVCKFGSIKVLNVQAPFGWNIAGPCPPKGLC